LSENTKFKKSGIDIKGLMTQEFAKIPILRQPVNIKFSIYNRNIKL